MFPYLYLPPRGICPLNPRGARTLRLRRAVSCYVPHVNRLQRLRTHVVCPRAGSAQTDREVLLHFYRANGGESWICKDGWAENALDLGSWHGVSTNAEGRVTKLKLEGGPEERSDSEERSGFEIGNNIIGKT